MYICFAGLVTHRIDEAQPKGYLFRCKKAISKKSSEEGPDPTHGEAVNYENTKIAFVRQNKG